MCAPENGPPATPPARDVFLPPRPPGRHDLVLGRHPDPWETRQLCGGKTLNSGVVCSAVTAPRRPPTPLSLLEPRHPGNPIDNPVNADAGRVQGGHTQRIEHRGGGATRHLGGLIITVVCRVRTAATVPPAPPLSLLDPRHPGNPIDNPVKADAGRVQGGHTQRIEHRGGGSDPENIRTGWQKSLLCKT